MKYNKAIFALLCQVAFTPLAGENAPKTPNNSTVDAQSQIAALDTQIQKLKNDRDVAAMRAYMAGNTADQVMDKDWLGYKTAIDKQSQLQELVAQLDSQIAELEKKKAALQSSAKK